MTICIGSSPRRVHPKDTVAELKACRNLESVKRIEAQNGNSSSISVANTLISMYSKYGSLEDARKVFDELQNRSVISWNTLIQGFAENGQNEQALQLFGLMLREGCVPNHRTFVSGLKACVNLAAKEDARLDEDGKLVKMDSLERGLAMHVDAANEGFDCQTFVGTSLLNMYAKCGSVMDAQRMFDRMQCRSAVSWNSLIVGYAENGESELALELFARMRSQGFEPDSASFVAALKACTAGRLLEQGVRIHFQAAEGGCDCHIQVANTLIDMYGKLRAVRDAAMVFERMGSHTVVSWTSLMLGYVENGEEEKALELFTRMEATESAVPDVPCYIAALKACSVRDGDHESLETICALHSRVACCGRSSTSMDNLLIGLYSRWGSMLDARKVFDSMLFRNTVSWATLISGYVAAGEEELALELFDCMRLESLAPDGAAIVAALKGCTAMAAKEKRRCKLKMASLEKGILLHLEACVNECDSQVFVENTLVDMYAKCGSMLDAARVFDAMDHRTVVSWTALMLGYADNGKAETSLKVFAEMRAEGFVPDSLCFAAVLKACTLVPSLELGKEIHADIRRYNLETDQLVANSLVHFYGACGSMGEAQRLFDSMTPGM